MTRAVRTGDLAPTRLTKRHRTIGIDAEQLDAPKNERQYRASELRTACIAKAGHHALRRRGAQDPPKNLAADRIHGSGPSRGFNRLPTRLGLFSSNDLGCAERAQIAMRIGFA